MAEEFSKQFLIALISVLSNFLSAFTGGGAGLIQLPALIFLGLPFSKALATHKIASIALGVGASIRHKREKTLKVNLSKMIILFGIPGVIFGAKLVLFLPDQYTTFILGILTLLLGIYSSRLKRSYTVKNPRVLDLRHMIIGYFILFLIAILNGWLSSGTGLFVTLWLVKWFGMSYLSAVAHTLILVGIGWNSTGAIILALNNEVQWSWIPILILGSITGGYLGASFGISKGEEVVKRYFDFISIIIGLSLISKSVLTMP